MTMTTDCGFGFVDFDFVVVLFGVGFVGVDFVVGGDDCETPCPANAGTARPKEYYYY